MTTRRPISWFLTDTGRKFSFAAVTAAGVAFTSVKFAPHTFFLYKYKEFVHNYSNGREVPLQAELDAQYKKCLDILKVPDVHRKLIVPFSVCGLDLFHAGSCASRFGAAVGIPVNFTYKTEDDIDKINLQVNLKRVNWSSEVGQKLVEALILPEKVQQFAICREILATQNNKIFLDASYPIVAVCVGYTIAQNINKRLNLYAAPTALRSTLYMLTGLFSLGLYFFLKDYTEVYYETEVDKALSQLGTEYIESGVIFYEKLLKRNQALRELLGKEGETKYSKLGNEIFFLRQPRLALMHRKQYFEGLRKDNSEEKDDIL